MTPLVTCLHHLADLGTGLIAGIEGREWQRTHGSQIALQPFSDRLALAAQSVALTLAALLLKPDVASHVGSCGIGTMTLRLA